MSHPYVGMHQMETRPEPHLLFLLLLLLLLKRGLYIAISRMRHNRLEFYGSPMNKHDKYSLVMNADLQISLTSTVES